MKNTGENDFFRNGWHLFENHLQLTTVLPKLSGANLFLGTVIVIAATTPIIPPINIITDCIIIVSILVVLIPYIAIKITAKELIPKSTDKTFVKALLFQKN